MSFQELVPIGKMSHSRGQTRDLCPVTYLMCHNTLHPCTKSVLLRAWRLCSSAGPTKHSRAHHNETARTDTLELNFWKQTTETVFIIKRYYLGKLYVMVMQIP